MPKEQINYPHWYKTQPEMVPHDFVESEATALAKIDPALSVHWAPNGNVVLSLRIYQDELWSAAWPTREPNEVRTPCLARGEINTLIRTLRRARDQAYGRDE